MAAGLKDPAELGSDLLLVIDGANARVVVANDRSAMTKARNAAERLIRSAQPTSDERTSR